VPVQNNREAGYEKRVEALELNASDDRILYLRTHLEIYDLVNGECAHIESRPDLDLLLDPVEGVRILRHELDDEGRAEFDAIAAESRLIDIPITCHPKQVEPITDGSHKILGMIAGNRSGKTEVLGFRFLRRWMLRGGRDVLFWWVAPTRKMCHIAVQKLCRNRGDRPPILPRQLFTSFPKNERTQDQAICMIDGSRLELHHAASDGDNLKGHAIADAFIDEICSIGRIENYRIVTARTNDLRGTVAVASTPKLGHWARPEIIVRAQHSDLIGFWEFSAFANPFIPQDELERAIQAMGGHDDPVVRREYYGEFVGDGAELWPYWNPERHLVIDSDAWSIEDLVKLGRLPAGYKDVTAQMAVGRNRWKRSPNARAIIGQDWNVDPMTGVIFKGFGIPHDRSTWGVFILDEVQQRGTVERYAEKLRKRGYENLPIACDATGAQENHTGQMVQNLSGSSTNAKVMNAEGWDCIPCYRRNGKPQNPRQRDSLGLCHWLFRRDKILVASRCKALMKALDTQECAPDGRIAKVPGQASDRLSAPSDAMRYGTWRLFVDDYYEALGSDAKARRER